MKAHAASQRKGQRGIGLIEVMIALTIGLVLLIGVAQYFISMRQTAVAAQKLSAFQNQQRMAMYFLHVAIAGAGYNPDPMSANGAAQYPANATFPTSGLSLIGSGSGATTKLTVRFIATLVGTEQGCSANLTPGNLYTDEFTVSNGYLVCTETNNTTGVAAAPLQLIGDPVNKVSGLSIRYAVDAQNSLSAQQYLAAADVTTANLWSNVMSVEVTLQFLSPVAGQFGQASNATVQLMETIPYMTNI